MRIISSRVNKPIGGLKSGVFQAAPGVRVRIKPVIRQPEEDPVTIPPEETTHDYDIDTTEGLTSPSPIVDVTEEEHLLSSVFEAPTTPEDEEHHKGRKKAQGNAQKTNSRGQACENELGEHSFREAFTL